MNKININKIAVKFDVENTTEELFNSVVDKFVELGYDSSVEDVNFYDLRHWNILLIDTDGYILLANSYWFGLKDYTIMSPEEFLALGETLKGQAKDTKQVVVEWLDKLYYVLNNEGEDLTLISEGLLLPTRFGDIVGSQDIYEFIINNYDSLKIAENTQKKAELEAKRQKLMDELSEIDQQLGLYK